MSESAPELHPPLSTPRNAIDLPLTIQPQPDDTTCGPTCLQAVYAYDGCHIELARVIDEVGKLATGGTLAVLLALHALGRGYQADLYTFNLQVFDPSWFAPRPLTAEHIAERLNRQAQVKSDSDPRLAAATHGYLEYLRRGGRLHFQDLTSRLLSDQLRRGRPILTGLSATYLYHAMRERPHDDQSDDLAGTPAGHFVLITGLDPVKRTATVADPLLNNPGYARQRYTVPLSRLVGAIMLGVLTYDANLLVLHPPAHRHEPATTSGGGRFTGRPTPGTSGIKPHA